MWWLILKHQEGMLVKANWKLEKEKGKAETVDESMHQEDLDDIIEYLAIPFKEIL